MVGTNLNQSTLLNANLTGGLVTGAGFYDVTSRGFTAGQLYSTQSYHDRNLCGIGLGFNDLSGWDFAGQDLTNAHLGSSTLTDANLTGANLTNADFVNSSVHERGPDGGQPHQRGAVGLDSDPSQPERGQSKERFPGRCARSFFHDR